MSSPTAAPQLPVSTPAEARRTVFRLARPHRGTAIGAVVTLVLQSIALLVPPAVVGIIIDRVIEGAEAEDLVAPVLVLGGAALLGALLTSAGVALVARLGENVLAALREEVVDHALHTSQDHLERAGTGDLLARVSNDVQVVSEATRTAFPALVAASFTIVVTFLGITALDWRLALAGMLAVPIQLLSLRWHLRRSRPVYAEQRAADSARAQRLYDAIGGVVTVRAFGLAPQQLAGVAERSEALTSIGNRSVRQKTGFYARLNLAELVGLGSILLVGFWLVDGDLATVGAVTAAALYFQQLFDPVVGLLSLSDEAQRATAALERLVGVLHLDTPTPTPDEIETSRHRLRGTTLHRTAAAAASIRLDGVGFAYGPGPLVVREVDLHVEPGEHVALVGTSGAGKSTLAKLVAGVHQATEGTVELGGLPVAELGAAGTRRLVALVTQEAHVFAGPLAEDLRLVRPDATDDELLDALEVVEAAAWVRSLPEGLDTEVGTGGRALTTTQGLQVALARLVLLDPAVAVLDEATADAGSASARALERAAERVVAGRTAIVVAHRLSQAAQADRILVMEHGRVIEAGTHDDLAAGAGAYARLWSAWSASRPG